MSNSEDRKLKCDEEQYEMLLRCSAKNDISEWNDWREKNPDVGIWLQGADFQHANLQHAVFWKAHLQGADFGFANLQGADFRVANLQCADLRNTNLQGAMLSLANLQGANFWETELQGAWLMSAHLQGAIFSRTEMHGTKCGFAIVDGKTFIRECKINENTDFTGVGLDSARIDPGLKQLLEYNIRRKRWRERYKRWHCLQRLPVWLFWLISDYGRSTIWIAIAFFVLALAFAGVYWLCPGLLAVSDGGGIHGSMSVQEDYISLVFDSSNGGLRGFMHAFYFSVVTMTTLGFGDIHANPDSWCGQALLMFQVLLGYVLLGVLITRLAVLFTSGGPASMEYFERRKTGWMYCKQMVRIANRMEITKLCKKLWEWSKKPCKKPWKWSKIPCKKHCKNPWE